MDKLIKHKAKITKIKSLNYTTKEMINEGQQVDAYFYIWPKLHDTFIFYDMKYKFPVPIETTEVIQILDNKKFRTINSIYEIYTIEQEREDKINKILK